MSLSVWTVPHKWRGKECHIVLNGDVAYLNRIGPKPETVMLDGLTVTMPSGEYHTLREGCGKGLESNRAAISGRCVLARAISLAVHLGASAILIVGGEVIEARDRRNLETLVRPLKSRRVTVTAAGQLNVPFPTPEA